MLMAGSTTKLFCQLVLALLLMGFWGWVAPEVTGSGGITLFFVMLCLFHSVLLTINLVDLKTPVLSAGPNGIVLSGKITGVDLIGWDEIKRFQVVALQWPVAVPLLSYLVIHTGKARHFTGLSRFLPTSWIGLYLVPTRLLKGGAKAARQLAGTVRNIREDERHAAVGNDGGFMSSTSLGWAMVRNTTFPIGKDGPDDEAIVAAARDSLLEAGAGIHRDLLPEPVRQQLLANEDVKKLAAIGESWGRQHVRESRPVPTGLAGGTPSVDMPQPAAAPKPSGFGQKGVTLNGKPLK